MINSSHLSKLTTIIFFLLTLNFNSVFAEEEPADIWKKKKNENGQSNQVENEITIESPIISDDINKITIKIDEDTIEDNDQSVIGIFDPEENNFNLSMWSETDGQEIKKVLKRIEKLKLSKVLFFLASDLAIIYTSKLRVMK